MSLAGEAPQWLALIFAILLIVGGAQDSAQLRISNIIVLLVIAAGAVAATIVGLELDLWENLAVFAALLAIGTWMFGRGMVGGGDVKFLAATGLWFDLGGAAQMLLAVVLSGGVLALLIVALRLVKWSEGIRRRVLFLRPGTGVPYGVAIAAGALIATALQR